MYPPPPPLPPPYVNIPDQANQCPCAIINPANGPLTWNQLFGTEHPCTCGQHCMFNCVQLGYQVAECAVHGVKAPDPLECTCYYQAGPCPRHGTNHINANQSAPPDEPNHLITLRETLTTHALPPLPLPAPLLCPAPAPMPTPEAQVQAQIKKAINVRAKGQRGEREVVHLLQAIVDKVHRDRSLPPIILQRNALQAHLGGADIYGLEGFSIEVKFQEIGWNPEWWKQTVAQARPTGAVPILFYRASKMKWKVRMRAFVNTPRDRDQLEMDCDVSLDDFVEWFGNSYDEKLDAYL